MGTALYLPERVGDAVAHDSGPAFRQSVRFQEKWRLGAPACCGKCGRDALAVTAVLADAEFGDVTAFRAALHRLPVCRMPSGSRRI